MLESPGSLTHPLAHRLRARPSRAATAFMTAHSDSLSPHAIPDQANRLRPGVLVEPARHPPQLGKRARNPGWFASHAPDDCTFDIQQPLPYPCKPHAVPDPWIWTWTSQNPNQDNGVRHVAPLRQPTNRSRELVIQRSRNLFRTAASVADAARKAGRQYDVGVAIRPWPEWIRPMTTQAAAPCTSQVLLSTLPQCRGGG